MFLAISTQKKVKTKMPSRRPLGICGVGTFHFVACFASCHEGELDGLITHFLIRGRGQEGTRDQEDHSSCVQRNPFPSDLRYMGIFHGLGRRGLAWQMCDVCSPPLVYPIYSGRTARNPGLGNAGLAGSTFVSVSDHVAQETIKGVIQA